MSTIEQLLVKISALSVWVGDNFQLRGFKEGGTAGQVPTKVNGTDFNWTWQTPASGGVTDHGALTGLADNDHPQYALSATLGSAAYEEAGDFASAVHTHPATDVNDSTVAGRAILTAANAAAQRVAMGLGSAAESDIGDFQPASAKLDDLSGLSYVGNTLKVVRVNVGETGFELATVVSSGGDLLAANNLSDLADAPTARTNLGLGTAATSNTGDFATAAQGSTADNALPLTGGTMSGNIGFTATETLSMDKVYANTSFHGGSPGFASAAPFPDGVSDGGPSASFFPAAGGTLASETYVDAKVADAINDGETVIAPSQNAVFDALAGKADTGHTHVSADITDATASPTPDTVVLRSSAGSAAFETANGKAIEAYATGSGIGVEANSNNGTGLTAESINGAYHAIFGASGGDNRTFIERVLGGFGWARGAYEGVLKAAATLTANRTWTLPDETGTIALTSDIPAPVSTIVGITGTTAQFNTALTDGDFATLAGSETLTNKRITPRIATIVSSGTPTINTDNCDCVTITALAAAITSMTTNLSGTPSNFDQLVIRIKDNGTARAITWGALFAARGGILPTTTVISKVWTVLFIYNSVTSTWDCVSSSLEV